MYEKIRIYFIALLGLLAVKSAYAVGLNVGAFGGIAVPTGGMRTDGGFDLSSSPKISVIASLELQKSFGLEFAAGYHFDHTPRTKEHEWAEYTNVMPINIGVMFKAAPGRVGFSSNGGTGYYFLRAKLVGTIRPTGAYDTGFGNRAYPALVNIYAPGVYGEWASLTCSVNSRCYLRPGSTTSLTAVLTKVEKFGAAE